MLNGEMSLVNFSIGMCVSIALGLFISLTYMYRSKHTKSFVVTLSVLPVIVSSTIFVINGNIGAGVALTGVFSLIRFRSVPGSAKEIGAIFLAMGAGLIVGMGYVLYAVVFTIILGCLNWLYTHIGMGESRDTKKVMKITIPEDLDYSGFLDDIFEKYADHTDLLNVKSTNMGSLFKLEYEIDFKSGINEKNFIDEVRCRNGNLEISILKHHALGEL